MAMAMKKTRTLCIVSVMDSLWYHQIILWSDPLSSHLHTILPFINFPSCPSPSPSPLPFSSLMDEITIPPSVSSDDISLVSQEDCNTDEEGENQDGKSSKSTKERRSTNNLEFSVGRKLNKSTNCKSMGELELEEVKGFMDLGFEFKKENLSPQMVKLLPGLQRLRTQIHRQNLVVEEDHDDDDDEMKREIAARPYLSKAWPIVKRPNSPLLNLRVPKVCSTSDMKKHLKSWAKTIASQIQ